MTHLKLVAKIEKAISDRYHLKYLGYMKYLLILLFTLAIIVQIVMYNVTD